MEGKMKNLQKKEKSTTKIINEKVTETQKVGKKKVLAIKCYILRKC